MSIIFGDLYTKTNIEKYDYIGFTANSIIKKDKRLVMGAGNAKIVRNLYIDIDLRMGKLITESRFYLCFDTDTKIFALQTKEHFKDDSELNLVKESLLRLYESANYNPNKKYALPFPGINHGNLNLKDVYTLLTNCPSNIDIWYNNQDITNELKELKMSKDIKIEEEMTIMETAGMLDGDTVKPAIVMKSEDEPITKHAVIYTDGSAKNLTKPGHPGDWSCGLHGYIYSSNNLDNKNGDKPNGYILTDIGYVENSQLAKDVYKTVIVDQYLNGYESYAGIGTNNTGEITGILLAITEMLKNDITSLYIKTDSTYAMHVFETVKSDPAKNWDRADLKNRDYYFIVDGILKEAAESNMKIRIIKVAGHSTALGNHLADRMALLGRLNSTRYHEDKSHVIYTDPKKYWKPKLERHPFLGYKQLFFTNQIEPADGPGVYSILDFKKDDETGKKSSSSTYGLVVLNEKVPEIENVKRIYQKELQSLSLISSLELSMIYNQNSKLYDDLFGGDVYTFNRRGRKYLSILEEDIVCTEVYPPGLAKSALDKTLLLGNILDDYRGNQSIYKYSDISDKIYKTNEDGKIETIITQDDKMLALKHDDIDIVLQLNNDMLSRNQFKKIEKEDTDVILVTIEKTKRSVEYFTIVHMKKTNDIIILCNFYSNVVYHNKEK